MFYRKNKYLPFVLLFLTALFVRFGAAVYWEHFVIEHTGIRAGDFSTVFADSPFYFGDSDTYWQLGKAIAEGKTYSYGGNYIHRMPGYPVLLSPLFLISGNSASLSALVFAARIENIIFSVLTVFAVTLLAQQLFHNRNISLLAGLFAALDPLQIVISVLVLSEAPFCLFMMLQLLFFVKGLAKTKVPASLVFYILSGLMYAAAVYCRPSWLYFVPFSMLLGVIFCPYSFRKISVSGIIICAVLVLCLCPWWYRNYQITGHFVSTTLQAGPSLYDGLSPTASGKSDMSFVETFKEEILEEETSKKAGGFSSRSSSRVSLEYKFNQKMREAAINWAKKHPDKALALAKSKFFRLWNFFPNEESFSSTAVKIAVFCSFSPIFILGLCGAAGSFRKGLDVQILWFPAVYITLLHIVFVSSIRYRCPAMLCFAILAAWCIHGICQRRKRI